jgi:copper(I)-binding protein
MRTIRTISSGLAIVLLLSACGDADAPDPSAEEPLAASAERGTSTDETAGIVVHDARSRMSPRVANAAAIYLTLQNPTDADDALVAAHVPEEIAGRVELHETYEIEDDAADDTGADSGGMHGDDAGSMDDAGSTGHGGGSMDDGAAPMMGMREIPSIPIPAGGEVQLVPGGLHLMVLDLVDDLEVGAVYEVTLEFEHAEPMTVTVEVRADV